MVAKNKHRCLQIKRRRRKFTTGGHIAKLDEHLSRCRTWPHKCQTPDALQEKAEGGQRRIQHLGTMGNLVTFQIHVENHPSLGFRGRACYRVLVDPNIWCLVSCSRAIECKIRHIWNRVRRRWSSRVRFVILAPSPQTTTSAAISQSPDTQSSCQHWAPWSRSGGKSLNAGR